MKQHTKTHNRRLTRKEKIIVSNAGLNPNDYLFAGENEQYLFLKHKRFIENATVPKAPNTKNASPGVSVSVTARGA